MRRARALIPVSVMLLSTLVSSSEQPPAGPLPPSVSLTLPASVTSLAVVNRSPRVAAGLADGRVAIWSPNQAATSLMLQPHTARVLAVGTTADGAHLLSIASDGTLARTPVAPGATPVSSKVDLGPMPTRAAAFSPDGTRLVTGGERGDIRVFDTATGAVARQLVGHRTELQAIAMQPGTAIVASASAEADLRLWDASAGRAVKQVDCGLSLFALEFSPRDGTLAAGGVGRRLTFYDPKTFEPTGGIGLQAPNIIAALTWSRDGGRIALGYIDSDSLSKGGILVVDASTHDVVATLDTGGAPAFALAFGGTGAGAVVGAFGRDLQAWALAR